jgi:hypothetical protein
VTAISGIKTHPRLPPVVYFTYKVNDAFKQGYGIREAFKQGRVDWCRQIAAKSAMLLNRKNMLDTFVNRIGSLGKWHAKTYKLYVEGGKLMVSTDVDNNTLDAVEGVPHTVVRPLKEWVKRSPAMDDYVVPVLMCDNSRTLRMLEIEEGEEAPTDMMAEEVDVTMRDWITEKVHMDGNGKDYEINVLRNGGTSYNVSVKDWNTVTVTRHTEEEEGVVILDDDILPTTQVERVMVGHNSECEMTTVSGSWESQQYYKDGVAVLLHLEGDKYMLIEDMYVVTFTHKHRIVRYVANVGNNAVTYGYAVDERGNVLLPCEKKDEKLGVYFKPPQEAVDTFLCSVAADRADPWYYYNFNMGMEVPVHTLDGEEVAKVF